MAASIPELNIIKPCIETVFVQIQSKSLLNNRKLIIGCIYRPPHSDVTNFNTEFISICEALKSKKECIYLCGDINLNLLSAKHNNSIADFVNTLALFEYVPLINKPTRCTDTCRYCHTDRQHFCEKYGYQLQWRYCSFRYQ